MLFVLFLPLLFSPLHPLAVPPAPLPLHPALGLSALGILQSEKTQPQRICPVEHNVFKAKSSPSFAWEVNANNAVTPTVMGCPHRITEWLRLEGTSGGHLILEPVAQDCVQTASEYLYNLSGPPVPVLGHPQSKEVFPDVQTEPSAFQFVPVTSCPVTAHH